jgi:hypothetical protein
MSLRCNCGRICRWRQREAAGQRLRLEGSHYRRKANIVACKRKAGRRQQSANYHDRLRDLYSAKSKHCIIPVKRRSISPIYRILQLFKVMHITLAGQAVDFTKVVSQPIPILIRLFPATSEAIGKPLSILSRGIARNRNQPKRRYRFSKSI